MPADATPPPSPRRSPLPRRRSPRAPAAAFCAALAFFAAGTAAVTATPAAAVELPSIGEPADRSLSPRQEREIGAQIMAQFLAAGIVLEDPQVADYITDMGRRLAKRSGADPNQFTFFVVREDSINAFALPGGYIGIHTGLIMASRTESELAGVMAHEIAHVTQRHIARQLQGNEGWSLATAALVVAAIAAGAADPDVIQAALGIGLGSLQQRQINHTRAHETEADRLGIRTLAAADYNPEGMATFFERMHQSARLYGSQVPEILRTHPVTVTRISEARARLDALGTKPQDDGDDYAMMRARARAMSSPPGEAMRFFRAGYSADDGDVEARYGLAVTELLDGNGKAALDYLQPLLTGPAAEQLDTDGTVAVAIAAAQAEQLTGDIESADERLAAAIRLYPNHLAAPLARGELLLRAGRPARARDVILESEALARHRPEAYQILALAARDSDDHGEAHYQMAAYFRYRGNYRAALAQLASGLRRDDITPAQRSRLKTREARYLRDAPEQQLRPVRSRVGFSIGGQGRRQSNGRSAGQAPQFDGHGVHAIRARGDR